MTIASLPRDRRSSGDPRPIATDQTYVRVGLAWLSSPQGSEPRRCSRHGVPLEQSIRSGRLSRERQLSDRSADPCEEPRGRQRRRQSSLPAVRGLSNCVAAIEVTDAGLLVLLEALDALEYWQLGDGLPRHDGMVWIPGDSVGDDRFWDRQPTPEENERIESVRRCRLFASRLSGAGSPAASGPST